jgi:hypothetical protein
MVLPPRCAAVRGGSETSGALRSVRSNTCPAASASSFRPRDHLGRKSDAAVLDGGEDPIAAHADFDFHRVVGSCVLDRVCECLAEGDEKVREVVVANPVFEGKLGDSIAYESRSMGLRCDLEVQHRFKSIHRRYRWFPYGSI